MRMLGQVTGCMIVPALVACLATANAARADQLALWTFETSVPTTAGPHAAEGGINGGSALGFHSDGGVAYSNPSGNGSPESFSSNFWNAGDYYEFQTSTVGYTDISISWDQTRSSTGPVTFDLEWSTDGSSFTTLLDDYTVLENSSDNGGFWSSSTFQPAYVFGPISGPSDLDNQATVYFRLTAQAAGTGTSGTNRVDNVSIDGIPEPTSLVLLGIAALAAGRRRA